MFADWKYAVRMLRKNPGFTAVAVLSLALGIGAGTAVFSLVNAILLRSLPVPDPQELRVLQWSGIEPRVPSHSGKAERMGKRLVASSVSHPMFLHLRQQGAEQADLFGFCPLKEMVARGRNEAFLADGMMVSDNFFSTLGVRPLIGRVLNRGEDYTGAASGVVISHDWWERHFASDSGVLGQAVTLNGSRFMVVGVLPRGFTGIQPGEPSDVYIPMSAASPFLWKPLADTNNWFVRLMARLKPGASDRQLQAMLDVAFTREVGILMKEPRMSVEPGRGGLAYDRNRYRRPLLLMLSVVALVLLVACANIAGLSSARGAVRQHELVVRAALGASRWRLIRQSIAENLLLAAVGGGLGILLAAWGKTILSRLLAGSTDGLHYDFSLDLTVLGFSLAVAMVAALLSGSLPAFRAGRADPVDGLKSRGILGVPRLRSGKVLVSVQFCLSLLLLAGAGLYVRTLMNLGQIEAGFNEEKLLLFQLNPGSTGYQGAQITAFYERMQNSLAALPGVKGVALLHNPLIADRYDYGKLTFLNQPAGSLENTAYRLIVSENFFATMGIPVLNGRGLTASDSQGAPHAVVVNEAFVRKYMPHENPIGRSVNFWGADRRIVGVSGNAKYKSLKEPVPPTVYLSFRQQARSDSYFAVRTVMPPTTQITAVRKAIAAIDPNIPLANITTQEAVRDKAVSQERIQAWLCGVLAGLALLLSCIGLYSLMAYHVARRTGEIAVRMALGATRRHIAGPILREALFLASIGIGIGLPVVFALTKLVKNQLYGVEPNDPFILAAAVMILMAVVMIAAWIPTRRATRIDPMKALRCE